MNILDAFLLSLGHSWVFTLLYIASFVLAVIYRKSLSENFLYITIGSLILFLLCVLIQPLLIWQGAGAWGHWVANGFSIIGMICFLFAAFSRVLPESLRFGLANTDMVRSGKTMNNFSTTQKPIENMTTETKQQTGNNHVANLMVAQMQSKNSGIGIFLALFFGPLGLLYASVAGGLIMLVVGIILGVILAIVSAVTLGAGLVVAIPVCLIYSIVCVIWAIVAINAHNKKLIHGATSAN